MNESHQTKPPDMKENRERILHVYPKHILTFGQKYLYADFSGQVMALVPPRTTKGVKAVNRWDAGSFIFHQNNGLWQQRQICTACQIISYKYHTATTLTILTVYELDLCLLTI